MRLHVVGGMGSGKTTLARLIAEKTGLPVHSLDDVAMQRGEDDSFRPLCPVDVRTADVHRIATQPAWITEGSFLWWTRELFEASDCIVWLDTPLRLALPRVIVRHVRDYLALVMTSGGTRQRLRALRYPHVVHLLRFTRLTWSYCSQRAWSDADIDDAFALCRRATEHELSRYAHKVVHCRDASDIAAVLSVFDPDTGRAPAPNLEMGCMV